jgi:hypothetical protein
LPTTNETYASAFGSARTLAAALPPDGSNPIGAHTRAVLTLKMYHHLPEIFHDGAYRGYLPSLEKNRVWQGKDPPEDVRLFFLGQERVHAGKEFWRSFLIAVYADFLYENHLYRGIDIDKVKGDLLIYNSKLSGARASWYAVIAGEFDGDIKTALAAIPEAARPAAREAYISGLTSDAYINLMATRYNASGSWSNRDWDLFHHWIKLKALGASDDEIDRTITEAKDEGLPVPDDLQAAAWRGWSKWLGADLRGSDLQWTKILNPWREDLFFLHDGPGQIYYRIG